MALFLVSALFLVVSACATSSGGPLPDDVVALLDVDHRAVADLTVPGPGVEIVDRESLEQAALRAKSAGTDLHIVIVDKDRDLISADSIVSKYPGTALSFKANDPTWGFASTDINIGQLERAMQAGAGASTMAETATAFVGVIESEGIERPSKNNVILLTVLFLASLAFFIGRLMSFLSSRKRKETTQQDLDDRKAKLVEQVGSMRNDIAQIMLKGDDNVRAQTREHGQRITDLLDSVNSAQSVLEIDEAEIRLNTIAMKLNSLRSQ